MSLRVLSWKNIIKMIVYFIFYIYMLYHYYYYYYYYNSLFCFEICGDMFVPK